MHLEQLARSPLVECLLICPGIYMYIHCTSSVWGHRAALVRIVVCRDGHGLSLHGSFIAIQFKNLGFSFNMFQLQFQIYCCNTQGEVV